MVKYSLCGVLQFHYVVMNFGGNNLKSKSTLTFFIGYLYAALFQPKV